MAQCIAALLVLCLSVGSLGTTTQPQQQETASWKNLFESTVEGDKGEKRESGAVPQTNWKQCVWRIKDHTDSGKLKDCSFNKMQSNTALKVSFQGNTRVYGSGMRCSRWFFKFNGTECSGPMTIEAVVFNSWPSGNPNLLHHRSFEGYCENIPQGAVTVELWVGPCYGVISLGSATTGWNSVSRIIIEEVSRSQS